MTLLRLAYVSTGREGLTDGDVGAILTTARRENARNGITGLLLYNGVNFLQILEGLKQDVLNLYQRLHDDTRHSGLVLLGSEDMGTHCFSSWSMKYLQARHAGNDSAQLILSNGISGDDLPADLPEALKKMVLGFNTLGRA